MLEPGDVRYYPMRAIVLSLVLLTASLFVTTDCTMDAHAAQANVRIELDKTNFTAEVTDEEGEPVVGTGVIIAEPEGIGPNVQWIKVDLEGRAEEFNFSVTPSSVVFPAEGGSSDMTWSVWIPEKTTSRTIVVIIEGRYSLIPGTMSYPIDPVYATIEVEYTPRIPNASEGGDEYKSDDDSDDSSDSIPGFGLSMMMMVVIVTISYIIYTFEPRRRRK